MLYSIPKVIASHFGFCYMSIYKHLLRVFKGIRDFSQKLITLQPQTWRYLAFSIITITAVEFTLLFSRNKSLLQTTGIFILSLIVISLYVLISQWFFHLSLLFINYFMLIPLTVEQYIGIVMPLSFVLMLICSTMSLIITSVQNVSGQDMTNVWSPSYLAIAWTIRSFYIAVQQS